MRTRINEKNRNEYTKTGFIAYHTTKINELLHGTENVLLAKKIILELISRYPDDPILLSQFAEICFIEGDYQKAVEIFEKLDPEKNIFTLMKLYIKLGETEKLFNLYNQYYKNMSVDSTYSSNRLTDFSWSIYLNKKFNSTYFVDRDRLSYVNRQLYDYSEKEAIECIISRHKYLFNNNPDGFLDDIDVKELYLKIRKYIANHLDEAYMPFSKSFADQYYFYLPQCGFAIDKSLVDYIMVNTIINTADIITMYPVCLKERVSVCKLDNENKKSSKVKVKSGLERFNERYKLS